MNNKLEVKYISLLTHIFFVIIGIIFSIATVFIGFFLFYSNFFEREKYLNLKNLYEYLKNNEILKIEYVSDLAVEFTVDENNRIFYWLYDGDFSWHTLRPNRCIVHNFVQGGILYNFYYKKTLNILKGYMKDV